MNLPSAPSAGAVVLATLACALIGWFGCDSEGDGPATITELPEDAPDREGFSSTILLTDSGWTKAILRVGHASEYIQDKETFIDSGLVVTFYDRDGSIDAVLSADSARIDDATGDMCAFGVVDVYSYKNRTTVQTPKLCYEKKTGKLHSDARVELIDSVKKRHINGVGFESNESLKTYRIYKVRGESSGESF